MSIGEADLGATEANAPFVRSADRHPLKMLRYGQMAGLVKLRRGIDLAGGRRLWAGHVDAAVVLARGREWAVSMRHCARGVFENLSVKAGKSARCKLESGVENGLAKLRLGTCP